MNAATPMPNAASALPTWLQEVLPGWLAARPALTEAIWASVIAWRYGLWSLTIYTLTEAWTDGALGSPAMLGTWLHATWWHQIIAYGVSTGTIGALRGKSAATKAAAATPQKEP